MLYIVVTAALAAIADLVWRLAHGGWDMPPWLQAVLILGAVAVVELTERTVHRLRVRRARAQRRAHARAITTTRRSTT